MALDPITALANLGNSIIDRILPDKAEAQKAKDNLAQLKVSGQLAQIAATQNYQQEFVTGQLQINQTEALSASKATNFLVQLFIAGWRPAVGWAGAFGFFYVTLGQPMLTFIPNLFGKHIIAPSIPTDVLMQVLFGLLGLGAMRSVEKVKGVSNGQ